jgi:O-antigen/teichoic acid export membrane protein
MGMIAVKTQTEAPPQIASVAVAPAQSESQRRVWGGRLSVSALADPGAMVSAGIVVNVLLARWLAAEEYAAFVLAFGLFLLLAAVHNVLVLEPMSILAPSTDTGNAADYFEAQIWVHLAFSAVLGVPLLVAGGLVALFAHDGYLAGAFFGGGLALPFILLLRFARRMCVLLHRPAMAFTGSICNLALVLVGVLALHARHKLTPLHVFFVLGFSCLCAALLLFHKLQIGLDESRACSVPWMSAAAENWSYGRSLVGGALASSMMGQTTIVLAALFLGLAGAAKLYAMQIPALVTLQCASVVGMLLLPGFAREWFLGNSKSVRQLAQRVSLSLGAFALVVAAIVYFTAAPLERLLFGGKFAGTAWLMPWLLVVPLAAGVGSAYSMALRAMKHPQYDLLATRIAAIVSVQTAFLFIPVWGLAGAAASLASGYVVRAAVVYVSFRQAVASERREFAAQSAEEIAPLEQFNS